MLHLWCCRGGRSVDATPLVLQGGVGVLLLHLWCCRGGRSVAATPLVYILQGWLDC